MSTEVALSPKQSADNALIAMIATAARDQSIDVEKLQKLVELRERILAKEAEIAFNAAMNAAQAEMLPILKDGENPHAHSRYATLEKVDREIRPIYTKNGFCLTFNTATPANPNAVHVTCEVRHSAGHKKEYFLEGDLDISGSQGKSNKTSIQGLGSSVSYLRRYLTLMIFNLTLTNEDNDGNGNRVAYDAMRHAADARQAARQAAEQAVSSRQSEPYYEPPPFDPEPIEKEVPTVDLTAELHASIEQFGGGKPGKKGRLPDYFELLKSIRKLHDELNDIGEERAYYRVLGGWGVTKSNEFPKTQEGRVQMNKCYNELTLVCAELKAYQKRMQEESEGVSK